jgi:cytochrome P450
MQAAVGRQEKYLAQRAKEPSRGDIVNAILDIDAEGVDWTVKASVLSTLTLGGVGTTGYAISSALHYLATHPEERKRLIENPELWLTATEEFLRFFAASPHDGRRVTRDTSVAGTELKPGEYVLMNYGAGSRDPDVFEQPYEVVLDRPLPNRHISFGYGVHRCIGSHLARLEVRVGLQEFLARYPDFSVPDDFEPSYQINNSVTLEQLPLLLS